MTCPAKTCIHVLESPLVSAGEEVRLARKARGMSQRALADAVGVNESTIWRVEKGAHKDPTTLGAIQAHLGIGPYAGLEQTSEPLLSDATDAQLLAEVADRLARARHEEIPGEGTVVARYDATAYANGTDLGPRNTRRS